MGRYWNHLRRIILVKSYVIIHSCPENNRDLGCAHGHADKAWHCQVMNSGKKKTQNSSSMVKHVVSDATWLHNWSVCASYILTKYYTISNTCITWHHILSFTSFKSLAQNNKTWQEMLSMNFASLHIDVKICYSNC